MRYAFLLLLLLASRALAGDIVIHISNTPPAGTDVYAELVAASQPDWQSPVAQRAQVLTESSTIHFEEIAPGEYALRLFADLNADGELTVSRRGLPQEPVGFSTCPVIGRRAHLPTDCAFVHAGELTTLRVTLVNLRQ